jgi:hypothetical protein
MQTQTLDTLELQHRLEESQRQLERLKEIIASIKDMGIFDVVENHNFTTYSLSIKFKQDNAWIDTNKQHSLAHCTGETVLTTANTTQNFKLIKQINEGTIKDELLFCNFLLHRKK